jgi:hypothetical protein
MHLLVRLHTPSRRVLWSADGIPPPSIALRVPLKRRSRCVEWLVFSITVPYLHLCNSFNIDRKIDMAMKGNEKMEKDKTEINNKMNCTSEGRAPL